MCAATTATGSEVRRMTSCRQGKARRGEGRASEECRTPRRVLLPQLPYPRPCTWIVSPEFQLLSPQSANAKGKMEGEGAAQQQAHVYPIGVLGRHISGFPLRTMGTTSRDGHSPGTRQAVVQINIWDHIPRMVRVRYLRETGLA